MRRTFSCPYELNKCNYSRSNRRRSLSCQVPIATCKTTNYSFTLLTTPAAGEDGVVATLLYLRDDMVLRFRSVKKRETPDSGIEEK